MKKLFVMATCALLFTACDERKEDSTTEQQLPDPSLTQPASEALTDSTTLVNDSVIMPRDTSQRTRRDSM